MTHALSIATTMRAPPVASLFVLFAVSVANAQAARPPRTASTQTAISADDLRSRLYLIADDSMMGRQPGEAGNYKAAEYVASEFKRLGLEPAGENGTYFQTVPFVLMAPDAGTYLEAGGTRFALGADVLLLGVPTTVRRLDNAPVVYGGAANNPAEGITADAASGKVVVLEIRPGPDGIRTTRGIQGVARDPRFANAALIAIVALDLL